MKKIGLFAAIAALLCGFLIYSWLNSVEKRVEDAQAEQKIETVGIITAAVDIPPYTSITQDMLSISSFPAEYVPANAAKSYDEVLGMSADGTIYTGEMILTTAISKPEQTGGPLSYYIPDGMRAMTISVNSVSGVAGYITKGDLIDVMVYYEAEPEKEENEGEGEGKDNIIYTSFGTSFDASAGINIALLEGVEVLEIDTPFYTKEGVYTSLTLALTTEQCTKLNLMQWREGATLSLALRARDDRSEGSGSISSLSEALG